MVAKEEGPKDNPSAPVKPKKRLLIFSIDGAAWEIIENMLAKGKLPNFKRLIDNGVSGRLRSVNPPVTCPAWATMFTGKDPGTLGVLDFFKPTPDYELKISPMNWHAWRPIWDIFSNYNRRVNVFNVPTTNAYEINGNFIAGPIWGEDEGQLAYPEELNKQLINEGYKIRISTNYKINGHSIYINDIKKITQAKFRTMYRFFKRDDWDLFIMGFYYCDQLQHGYWKDIDPEHPKYSDSSRFKDVIFEHYSLLDKYLGKILEVLSKDTSIIITSDHGHRVGYRMVNLNAWLYEMGYLSIKPEFKIKKGNNTISNLKNGIISIINLNTTLLSILSDKIGLRKLKFFEVLQNKLKDFTYVIEGKFSTKYRLKEYVHWDSTKAFSVIFNTIFLNLKDRQSKGTVSEKEYTKIRERIIDQLYDLTDPLTNKKVINRIWTKDELYPDSSPPEFPDIFIQFEKGYKNTFTEILNPTEIFYNPKYGSTEHCIDGVFIGFGPDFKAGEKINNVKLEDLVPTILHQFDYPVPDDIDGRVLTEIFKPDSAAAKRPVQTEPTKNMKKAGQDLIRSVKFSKKI